MEDKPHFSLADYYIGINEPARHTRLCFQRLQQSAYAVITHNLAEPCTDTTIIADDICIGATSTSKHLSLILLR